jgi:hypothetical protein
MALARVSAALLIAGAIAGSLAGAGVPERTTARHGEFLVLAGDFHIHGFPGDGALPAWALRDEARRRGLDVIALTNHNQRLAGRIGRWLSNDAATPLVLRAEEITAAHYHMAAVAIEHPIPGTLGAAEAIATVHAQGGVAIAAHPGKMFWGGFDAAARAALDGAEVAHPMVIGDPKAGAELIEFWRSTRELNPQLAPIGSTDYHFRQAMGFAGRTFSRASIRRRVSSKRSARDGPWHSIPTVTASGTPASSERPKTLARRFSHPPHGECCWIG